MKRGQKNSDVILDYTAEEKQPREAFRRNEIALMQVDPVSGRLLLTGGGNLRLDLAAGTTVEFPIVGCNTADLDYSPGGERMACVAVDAKGPESKEIILYDIATRKKVPLEIAGKGASWSPDGQFLAYVWRGRQLRVLELKTAKVTAYDIGHERSYLLPHAVEGGTGTRWSADGRFIHCTLEASKEKPGRNWYGELGEPTTLIVDRRDKLAWTRTGSFSEFEWAPATKP
jgi:dipeptidyl aminopeptidase/acylaminoacyl peptidase